MDKALFLQIVFYSFASLLVFAALAVVTARNTVYSAMFLVMAFFTCAALWILLQAEFLAIVLVLVYVGAVMVLFLFVVMMLNINHQPLREGFIRYLPIGILIALIAVAEMVIVITRGFGAIKEAKATGMMVTSNTKALGSTLYTDYLYQFEIAAVVLLLAIIAAIVLTLHHQSGTKHQNPGKQVQVKRKNRVRLVKMDTEKVE